MKRCMCVMMTALISAATLPAPGQEFYYDQDRTYNVARSDTRITVQFDTAFGAPDPGQFAIEQPCLDDTGNIRRLGRGFYVYGISPGCDHASTAAAVGSDRAVHRVVPVYQFPEGGEFSVTDLIDVKFRDDIRPDSARAILNRFGLHYVDANEYVPNLWIAALNDSINDSPLAYGNALHVLPEVDWACASMYVAPVLFDPTTPSTDPGSASGPEFYFDQDRIYDVTRSDTLIGVQFDTTVTDPAPVPFAAGQPCLDETATIEPLGRGFYVFGIEPGCGYDATAAAVGSDPTVHRVVPVYQFPDGGEFKVTDLIDVRFRDDLTMDSGLAILAEFGLHFVDSNEFVHNLWIAALDDSIRESPLAYGNALHVLPEVEWACAAMFVAPVLMSAPSDPYFVNQYYLNNTGQAGGVADADIDALEAWQFALADSDLVVAVIDDGLISHADLPASRLLPGRDFVGANWWDPVIDNDPRPGDSSNHGMACAGILGGSHNGSGIVGVIGSCRIVPVKIFDDHYPAGGADTTNVANAIYYAANYPGVRVISNSWGYRTTASVPAVAAAIRYATNGCGGGAQPQNPQVRAGAIMVFAAGNWDPLFGPILNPNKQVVFPANMPEVIAVGAVNKSNGIWNYSCRGDSLDLVAPSGNVNLQGDQWTIDQTDVLGWNPIFTGAGGNGRDIGVPYDYTSVMGARRGPVRRWRGLPRC